MSSSKFPLIDYLGLRAIHLNHLMDGYNHTPVITAQSLETLLQTAVPVRTFGRREVYHTQKSTNFEATLAWSSPSSVSNPAEALIVGLKAIDTRPTKITVDRKKLEDAFKKHGTAMVYEMHQQFEDFLKELEE